MLRFQTIAERYELRRQIGVGGTAHVYLAWDGVLHRNVAIKVLNEASSADPTFVTRFRREAQAAGALQSPHIVQVYDWGRTRDDWPIYYLVMEYVAGPNLKEVIRERGALPEGEALHIAADIAAALEVAHRQGIIHRDIKPQNVLLGPGGAVKVADFGIARATGLTQLTTTQSAVYGSAHYVSPEQVQHGTADERSDIYSLGAVLYEMLTGREPFVGESLLEVVLQHVSGDVVPPRDIRHTISAASDAIVMTCLAKDPAARFADAMALRQSLVRAGSVPSRPATVPNSPDSPVAVPVSRSTRPKEIARTRVRALPARTSRESRRARLALPSWIPALAATLLVFGAGLSVLHALTGGAATASRHSGMHGPATSPVLAGSRGPRPAPTSSDRKRHHSVARTTSRPHRGSSGGASGQQRQTGQPRGSTGSAASGARGSSAPNPTAVPTSAPPPARVAPAPEGPQPGSGGRTGQSQQAANYSGDPQQAVLAFYSDVSTHSFAAAAQLWTPGLRARDPPPVYIDDRFSATTGIDVDHFSVARDAGDAATVDVTLIEHLQNGAVRTLVGSWDLMRVRGTWLLDNPKF